MRAFLTICLEATESQMNEIGDKLMDIFNGEKDPNQVMKDCGLLDDSGEANKEKVQEIVDYINNSTGMEIHDSDGYRSIKQFDLPNGAKIYTKLGYAE